MNLQAEVINFSQVAMDVIQTKLHEAGGDSSLLKQSMQLVTNMWCLAQGLARLEDWTVQQVHK